MDPERSSSNQLGWSDGITRTSAQDQEGTRKGLRVSYPVCSVHGGVLDRPSLIKLHAHTGSSVSFSCAVSGSLVILAAAKLLELAGRQTSQVARTWERLGSPYAPSAVRGRSWTHRTIFRIQCVTWVCVRLLVLAVTNRPCSICNLPGD